MSIPFNSDEIKIQEFELKPRRCSAGLETSISVNKTGPGAQVLGDVYSYC